ncbi:MAG: hypothetical protein LBC68_13335 [Prevotellaceae bacterium]|jgi:hypothetical protein|nr:hypothetical protein [Prevotellaceae bacterium]
MKNKQTKFFDMTLHEIEEYEQKTNSIVLIDDYRGVAFQNGSDDEGTALFIIVDGIKRPIVLLYEQINTLKDYLNKNF